DNFHGNDDAKRFTFEKCISYPLMLINLQEISYQKDSAIKIEKIISRDRIIHFWSDLVANAYHISIAEFREFVKYLTYIDGFNTIKFYAGYYNNFPAATSMLIHRNNVVDIHWVGTLPELSNKVLGSAVTS